MADQLTARTEFWKQWRIADTRLHRIAARSLHPATSGAAEDVEPGHREHAVTSWRRAMILKRLASIEGGGGPDLPRSPGRFLSATDQVGC